jgi:hypothetical protein
VVVAPWLSQQPPPVHCWPGQHASPLPPQGWHEVPVHTEVPPEHCPPL